MTNYLRTSGAVIALVAGAVTPALAEIKYDNSTGGSVVLYGQFSPAFLSVDDGVSTYSEFADNAHSNTRVGLTLTQPMGNATFGFNFETALGLRSTDALSQGSVPEGIAWDRTKLRKVDFSYGSASIGTFYLGQGSMATDGVADFSYGGTGMALYNGVPDGAGSYVFRTTAGALSTISISNVLSSLDGGRRGRIRYDTPEFNGFTVAVAAGTDVLSSNNNDDFYDIALRHSANAGAAQVKTSIGFARKDSNGVHTDDTIGSVAVLLDSGVNFAVSAGSRNSGGDYVYGSVGYTGSWWNIGQTSIGVDYYDGSDFVSAGSESSAFGVAIQQKVDSINTEFYLGYRNHSLSEVGTSYHDISSVLAGARWKF